MSGSVPVHPEGGGDDRHLIIDDAEQEVDSLLDKGDRVVRAF